LKINFISMERLKALISKVEHSSDKAEAQSNNDNISNSDKRKLAKKRIITGLAFTGFGAVWLGMGFMAGLSRAKRKDKDHIKQSQAFSSSRSDAFVMREDGAKLARRALAYGTIAAVLGVGSIIGITCWFLEIKSISDIREISRAATKSGNSN